MVVWDFLTVRLLTIYCFVRRPDYVQSCAIKGSRSAVERVHELSGPSSAYDLSIYVLTWYVCVCVHAHMCVLTSLLENMIGMFWFMFVFTSMIQNHSLHRPQKYLFYHKLELHNECMEKKDSDDKISFFKYCKC